MGNISVVAFRGSQAVKKYLILLLLFFKDMIKSWYVTQDN